MKWCVKCVTPDTRPRVEFDEHGVCNACLHDDYKKTVDWEKRFNELGKICDKYRKNDGSFDIIVPVSGGKDSTYIAFQMRDKLKMNPLTITFQHPMPTQIGFRNWFNFINSGFSNILVTPDQRQYRKFARDQLIKRGMPKQPFVVGISAAIIKLAKKFDIKLICYAENGESEYGGKNKAGLSERFTRGFLVDIYYEGQGNTGSYGPWWETPSNKDMQDLYITWWSNFENWDPEDHAVFAKKHAGMEMHVGGNIGTFTNYAQNEDRIQDLHCFLMFIKFGFGRCTSDASIEIRRGRMTREQGVEVVRKLDGQFPVEYLQSYLDYFEMTEKEFWGVIDSHANKHILHKTNNIEKPWVLMRGVE